MSQPGGARTAEQRRAARAARSERQPPPLTPSAGPAASATFHYFPASLSRRLAGQLAPLTARAEPRGDRFAPPLPWAAHRLYTLLLFLPRRVPGTGDRCLTRKAQLHFSPCVPSSCCSPPPTPTPTPSPSSSTREPATPRLSACARQFPSRPEGGSASVRPALWHGSASPRFSVPWPCSAPRCWQPSSSRKVARKCDVSTCQKASTRMMPPRMRSTVGVSPWGASVDTGIPEKGPRKPPRPAAPYAGRRYPRGRTRA